MTATIPDGRHDELSGERRMWAAVLIRALSDALWRDENPDGSSLQFVWFFSDSIRRRQATRIRDEAIFWLTMPNRHFSDVCLLAGLDPDSVRQKSRKVLDGAKTNAEAKAVAESLSLRGLQ